MNSGSLRWRLMLGAALTILVALTLALLAMSLLFSRHVERALAGELERDALHVIASLSIDPQGLPDSAASLTDARYDRPAAGRYWQLASPTGSTRSLSLWDETLPAPTVEKSTGGWQARELPGPFGQRILLVERTVSTSSAGTPVTVQFAQDTAELSAARNRFRLELGLFLVALWLLLMLAAWVQITLGLLPLQRLRTGLEKMRQNPGERMDGSYPSEIEPLTSAINRLAEARERDVVRARRRAADLAHSLKTPLAAMGALSRRVRDAEQGHLADDLDRIVSAAGAALEAELARSRAAAIRDGITTAQADPGEAVERVVSVLERTERGGSLVYNIELDTGLRLPIANDDLMEVLGALIENATRFAKRQVLVRGRRTPQGGELAVEDDGPGLGISIEEALSRGGRLDETGSGSHGLGLSIARDIVDATGGVLTLARSELGGLQVVMTWDT